MSASASTAAGVCHALSPSFRLALTIAVMLAASLIPLEQWPAQGVLLAITFVGLSLAEVPVGYLARRLTLFLPMLLVLGLSVPLTQTRNVAAWAWMVSLWLRCLNCFLAGLWLIHVLPFHDLLLTLQRWHCPRTLVAMLAFMHRYIFVLWDELARLRRAREARDFGRATTRMRMAGNAQMIGLLMLRAMERAERTHQAMLARGWDGSMRLLGEEQSSPR